MVLDICACEANTILEKGFRIENGVAICNNCNLRNSEDSSETSPSISDNDSIKVATARDASLEQLIRAQNRTTHAVRSLAITIVAAPLLIALCAVCTFLALSTKNPVAIIIAGGGSMIACLALLYQSLVELTKSKISSK